MPPKPQTIYVSEDQNVSMSIKLLKRVLWSVAGGAFLAAGVFYQTVSIKESTNDIRNKLEAFSQRVDDHERRLIKIEAKTGIAKAQVQNANGWGK
jgi:hypothetical protein